MAGWVLSLPFRGRHTSRGRVRRQVALGTVVALFLTGLVAAAVVRRAAAVEPPPGGLVDSTPYVGWTQGEFAVGGDGAAQYSLPLWVPQGRGRVAPRLALSYNSRAGNGPLGVGWSLAGLPSIAPCPRTIAQDGHTDALRFDHTDAWCLGANRLVALSSSGAEREFRTEQETFARIIAYGMDDGRPDYFRVWAKDGLILTLGQTADARLQAFRLRPRLVGLERESTTRRTISWAVDRIEDRDGNAATVEYARTEGDEAGLWWADMRPAVIRYEPNRRVEFGWEEGRSDPIDGFAAGVHTRNPYRLAAITMWGGPRGGTAEKLREYRLMYQNTSITRRSLLARITELDQDGIPKVPLSLTYSEGSNEFYEMDMLNITDVGTSGTSGNRVFPLDFDGDGQDDLLYPDAQNNWKVRRSTGSGFGAAIAAGIPRIDAETKAEVRLIDLNLDGRTDVLAQVPDPRPTCDPLPPPPCPLDTDKTDWRLYPSTGATSAPPYGGYVDMVPDSDGVDTDAEPDPVYFLDLDGNGTPDFLTADYEKSDPADDRNEGPWRYRLNDGTQAGGWFQSEVVMDLGIRGKSDENNVADLDGDGRAELVGWYIDADDNEPPYDTATASVGLNAAGQAVLVPSYFASSKPNMGDFNGDGLTDRFGAMTVDDIPERGLYAAVNAGTGRQASPYVYWSPPAATSLRILDFDNDGRDDILNVSIDQLWRWGDNRFTGPRFLQDLAGTAAPGNGYAHTQPLDIDADGVLDIVTVVGLNHLRLLKRKLGPPDRLISIGDIGYTPRVEIYYTTLAHRSVHTPCTGATYPLVCPAVGGSIVRQHRSATYAAAGAEPYDTYVHTYQSARTDLQGRGWLGFAEHTVTRDLSGAITSTHFNNSFRDATTRSYPYALLPQATSTVVKVGEPSQYDESLTTNTWAIRHLSQPLRYTVELRKTVRAEKEGEPGQWQTLRTNTTDLTYDAFGNPDLVVSTTTGGRKLTEDATFEPDTTNWLVGLRTKLVSTGCDVANHCVARTSRFAYYANGNPRTTVVEPNQPALRLTTTTGYDTFGNVTSVTRSDTVEPARTHTFEYGNPDKLHATASVNAAGHRTLIETHSGLGVKLKVTDPNGLAVTMRYDKFGRLRETNRADGSFERITHGSFAPQSTTIDVSGGGHSLTTVDPLGREVQREVRAFDGRIAATSTEYDALGRTARVSRPAFPGGISRFTTLAYDNRDRLKSTTAPDGAVVRQEYIGLETHTYDAKNIHRYTVSNADGEIESSFEGTLETRFEYGPFGQTTKVTAPDGTVRSMRYDTLGRQDQLIDPSSGTTTMTYTAFGEPATRTDGAGTTTRYTHDNLSRVVTTTSPDGTAANTWDAAGHGIGKLASARSADGVLTRFTYNELSQLTRASWQIGEDTFEVVTGYDAIGRQASTTYPHVYVPGGDERLTVDYVYNQHGYLSQIRDAAAGGPVYWTGEARNAAGQLTRERLGNGVVATRSYLNTGLLHKVTTTGPGTIGNLSDLTYGYDLNRNVTSRDDTVNNRQETYGYDTLNRLKVWKLGTTTTTYTYDPVGNLETETAPDRSVAYHYGENGAPPHALTGLGNDHDRFTYDGAGRQLTAPRRTVTYNRAGLPKTLTFGQSELRREFAYDAGGARVRKSDSEATLESVPGLYERHTVHASQDPPDLARVENVHHITVEGRIVAQVIKRQVTVGGPLTATGVHYLHADGQDSTVQVSTGGGQRGREFFYDPWGERITADGQPTARNEAAPRQGYTGYEHDDDYGLINANGRIYDPGTRRFLSPDPFIANPLSSQGHNRYAYVANNPATYTDPTGLLITIDDTGWGSRGGAGPSNAGGWWQGNTAVLGGGTLLPPPTPFSAPLLTHVPSMAGSLFLSGGADDDETKNGSGDSTEDGPPVAQGTVLTPNDATDVEGHYDGTMTWRDADGYWVWYPDEAKPTSVRRAVWTLVRMGWRFQGAFRGEVQFGTSQDSELGFEGTAEFYPFAKSTSVDFTPLGKGAGSVGAGVSVNGGKIEAAAGCGGGRCGGSLGIWGPTLGGSLETCIPFMVCFKIEGGLGPVLGGKGEVGADGVKGGFAVGFAEIEGSVSPPEIDERAAGFYFWEWVKNGMFF